MSDARIVYGARCVWWDSIDKAALTGPFRIPCCPYCGSVLFEVENLARWLQQADRYELNGHPGYRAMIEWSRGKCFPSMAALQAVYELEKGDGTR